MRLVRKIGWRTYHDHRVDEFRRDRREVQQCDSAAAQPDSLDPLDAEMPQQREHINGGLTEGEHTLRIR